MLRVGVIGVGRWGKNHVRILKELEKEGKVKLEAVCDVRDDTVTNIRNEFRVPIAKTDYREILRHVDAVVISTSIDSLSKVAEDVLTEGVHALIEKPVAMNSNDAIKLWRIAQSNNVIAAPGMIMRFDNTVNKLKELLKSENVAYIVFKRLSKRPPNMLSYPILLDLGIHDIDLCRYLTDSEISEVIKAQKIKLMHDEILFASLKTTRNIYCIIHIDGVSSRKIREIDVITERPFIRADTIKNQILYYNPLNIGEEERIIQVEYYEPLRRELEWFVNTVKQKPANYSPSLYDAVENLRVIEAIVAKA
ncbi:MAG: Gfo/Idh/MocA family oxidoreductase [Ignisphaera sp.]